MRWSYLFIVLVLLSACNRTAVVIDKPFTSLPLTFGSSGRDIATDLARHGTGVYVTGYTSGNLYGLNQGEFDAFIRKYSAAGVALWGRQFGTAVYDGAMGVASDASSNAYVLATTAGNVAGALGGYDLVLRKYTPGGSVAWTKQFGSPALDYTGDIAVSGDGIYVVGYTTGSVAGSTRGGYDAFIRKYTPAGTVAWTRQFGTPQGDKANDVAIDGNGTIYVVGSTAGALGLANGGGSDVFIRRYNASGGVMWTKQLHFSLSDDATAVAAIGSSIYLLGQFDSGASPHVEIHLTKLNAAGSTLWSTTFGSEEGELALSAAADATGVVFSGFTSGDIGGVNQGEYDGFVAKYGSSGTLLWESQQGTSGTDGTQGVLLRNGQIYAAGYTTGVLGTVNNGDYDAFLRRLDSTGATVWTDQ